MLGQYTKCGRLRAVVHIAHNDNWLVSIFIELFHDSKINAKGITASSNQLVGIFSCALAQMFTESCFPVWITRYFIIIDEAAFGFEANLLGNMAEAPALLEGYMTLSGIFDKTNLSETERQIILMTNNRLNGCAYCMAAHTTISQGAGVP